MLIPYNTDAPLYYPPIATVGTIILNVLLFVPVFVSEDPYALEARMLAEEGIYYAEEMAELEMEEFPGEMSAQEEFGHQGMLEQIKKQQEWARKHAEAAAADGKLPTTLWRRLTVEYGTIKPWQWLTANYMHIGVLHLIGNMFVLWGFGLVVEGKVGWWRFLLIYNGIGVLGWALVQALMLFSDEGIALGASLAIFGLIVIALVWAPANEMQCIFMLGFRPISFEASIMNIATWSVFLQMGISLVHIVMFSDVGLGLRLTSEILHLIGAGFGCAVGVVMVKRNLVDCENWDVFSVWAGKNVRTRDEDKADVAAQLEVIKQRERQKLAPVADVPLMRATTDDRALLLNEFKSLAAAGKPVEAWNAFCRGQQQYFDWQVPEPDFIAYIASLRKQQLWEHAAGAMHEYLARYIERETPVRLALAQVLIQHLDRPKEAWEVLGGLNAALLSEKDKASYDKLRMACKQRVAAKKKPSTPG